MKNSKNRSILVLISIILILSSCDKKEEQAKLEQTQNEQVQTRASLTAQNTTHAKTTKVSSLIQINAFVSGTDVSKRSFEQGAELAQLGNANKTFNLKYFQALQAKAASKFITAKSKSPLAIYWNVDDISSVAPTLSGSETVGIVAGEVNKKVIAMGANVFGFGYSAELSFKQLAKFAGNTLKSYRFAVLTANNPRADLQSKVFIEESKSLGNTIVFEEKLAVGIADFNSLITRAETEKCDTIVALLPAPELVNIIKSAKSKKFKGKLIVGDTLYASDIAALGQDAEGIYMVQAWSDDADLKSKFTSKYGNTPDSIALGYAALGYDTVKCLQEVSAPFDAYTIKQSLLSTPCEGITGKTQFAGERIAQRKLAILTVKNAEIVKAE